MMQIQDTSLHEMAFCVAYCSIPEPKNALLSSEFIYVSQKFAPELQLNSKPYDIVVLNDMPSNIKDLKTEMPPKSVLVCDIGSSDINKTKKALSALGENFRIVMPFYNLHLIFASDYYHPTADIILQKSDLLDNTLAYNSDFHKACFVLPTWQIKEFLGIAKNWVLIDAYGRTIDYLRVSLTQACNFRCRYCMPTTPFDFNPKENLLSIDELFLFLSALIDEGIKKIRITGGEPTLREDLSILLEKIFTYAPNTEIALTTNGFLMPKLADKFAKAGLKRINISLDSLDFEVCEKITGKNVLAQVLEGIDASIKSGLRVKLNMVPLIGYNEDEIINILEYAKSKGMMIRFIEQMSNIHAPDVIGLKADEIMKKIALKYEFILDEKDFNSPAKLYKMQDGYVFGIIEPHRDDFCESCNRVRLTADGTLIPCLYFDEAVSVKEQLKKNDAKGAIATFKEMLKNKPLKNRWSEGESSNRAFYYTGG